MVSGGEAVIEASETPKRNIIHHELNNVFLALEVKDIDPLDVENDWELGDAAEDSDRWIFKFVEVERYILQAADCLVNFGYEVEMEQ